MVFVAEQNDFDAINCSENSSILMAAHCNCSCRCANCGRCGCTGYCDIGKCRCRGVTAENECFNSSELNDFFAF